MREIVGSLSSETLISMAKEAKLKNTAPIKYHIEVSTKYWGRIIEFLTGAENAGKALFSTFYILRILV